MYHIHSHLYTLSFLWYFLVAEAIQDRNFLTGQKDVCCYNFLNMDVHSTFSSSNRAKLTWVTPPHSTWLVEDTFPDLTILHKFEFIYSVRT